MTALKQQLEILRNDFLAAIDRCQPRQLRTLSQFALDEIIIPPGGPHAGERFSFEFQPFVKLLYEVIESGRFPRHAVTGPPQTGKTFNVLVVPLMFHLFEIEENVVYAIPTMVMAFDKWERDILPAIKASRYAHLLPEDGQGSKGGKFESITFKNGATLKFMSAKGGDEKRSGYTARVVMMRAGKVIRYLSCNACGWKPNDNKWVEDDPDYQGDIAGQRKLHFGNDVADGPDHSND